MRSFPSNGGSNDGVDIVGAINGYDVSGSPGDKLLYLKAVTSSVLDSVIEEKAPNVTENPPESEQLKDSKLSIRGFFSKSIERDMGKYLRLLSAEEEDGDKLTILKSLLFESFNSISLDAKVGPTSPKASDVDKYVDGICGVVLKRHNNDSQKRARERAKAKEKEKAKKRKVARRDSLDEALAGMRGMKEKRDTLRWIGFNPEGFFKCQISFFLANSKTCYIMAKMLAISITQSAVISLSVLLVNYPSRIGRSLGFWIELNCN